MNHAMPRWRYGDASAAENPGPPEPSPRVSSVPNHGFGPWTGGCWWWTKSTPPNTQTRHEFYIIFILYFTIFYYIFQLEIDACFFFFTRWMFRNQTWKITIIPSKFSKLLGRWFSHLPEITWRPLLKWRLGSMQKRAPNVRQKEAVSQGEAQACHTKRGHDFGTWVTFSIQQSLESTWANSNLLRQLLSGLPKPSRSRLLIHPINKMATYVGGSCTCPRHRDVTGL